MTWKGMVGQFTITGSIKGSYLETITHFIFWNDKKVPNVARVLYKTKEKTYRITWIYF